ncbi:hypothetical protein QAD02_010697 [Eretmocerus hayati]|uniref:Uncharacterized protein n=1 Tax=Eretmocerus hayati TaxID=131215 RepID=A0ACC2NVT8_9HYME|nr:hypothetical protein QAD02_010697 [Eretmocerus hayati]
MSYCSEKCKSEAWEQYHDVECTILHLQVLFGQSSRENPFSQIGFRILIAAIRQTGSLSALKANLEAIDELKGKRMTDCLVREKNSDYRHVYFLPNRASDFELDVYSDMSVINLFILAKIPSALVEFSKFHYSNLAELEKNDDVVFLAALLLKLCAVTASNCRAPIEKGAPIFDSICTIFSDVPKEIRQMSYEERMRASCHCQACEEDWPIMNFVEKPYEEMTDLSTQGQKVFEEIKKVDEEFFSQASSDEDYQRAKRISKFSKIVGDIIKDSPLPSKITMSAINCLVELMTTAHGFEKPQVPNECNHQ